MKNNRIEKWQKFAQHMETYIRTELYAPLSDEEGQYFFGLYLTLYE